MFCKKIFLFIFLSVYSFQLFTSLTLEEIQDKYSDALENMLELYKDIDSMHPIVFEKSDILCSAFDKVIAPYVAKINGFSNVLISSYSRGFSYSNNLKLIVERFNSYEDKVIKLIKKFPKQYQQEALGYFYNKFAGSLVTDCSKMVQGISYKLDLKEQSILDATIIFNLAMRIYLPGMKIAGFSKSKPFKATMTEWMLNLYSAAIKKLNEDLNQGFDSNKINNVLIQFYNEMAKLYYGIGKTDQSKVFTTKSNALKDRVTKIAQLDKKMNEALTKLEAGVKLVSIDFSYPSSTKSSLLESLGKLKSAEEIYSQSLSGFTSLNESSKAAYCKSKIFELNCDQYLRVIQLLWIMFLENSYRNGITPKVKSYSELQSFFKIDPTISAIDIDRLSLAFKDLIAMLQTIPNDFNKEFAILPLLKNASAFNKNVVAVSVKKDSSSNILDTNSIEQFQGLIENLIKLFGNMSDIANFNESINISGLIAKSLDLSKKIDQQLDKNKLLNDFCFDFSDLIVEHLPVKNFQAFFVQYLYRIAVEHTVKYQNQKENNLILLPGVATLLFAVIKEKSYLNNYQAKEVDSYIESIIGNQSVESWAKKFYQKAQKLNDWKNSSKNRMLYHSKSLFFWNNAAYLYQIAIALSMLPNAKQFNVSSTDTLESDYIQVLKDYLSSLSKNIPRFLGYQLYALAPLNRLNLFLGLNFRSEITQILDDSYNQLFSGNYGLFAEIKAVQDSLASSSLSDAEKELKNKQLSDLIDNITSIFEEQTSDISSIKKMLAISTDVVPVLQVKKIKDGINFEMKIAGASFSENFLDPIVVELNKLKSNIDAIEKEAASFESKADFKNAAKYYQQVENLSTKFLTKVKNNKDRQLFKQKYFLAKSRQTASMLASEIDVKGSDVIGELQGIPSSFILSTYNQPTIDLSLFGASTIPSDFVKVQKESELLGDQKIEALAILKANFIYKLLNEKGLKFLDCYQNYKLQKKDNLSKDLLSSLESIEAEVSVYMNGWGESKIFLIAFGIKLDFTLNGIPIPAITPLYNNGPSAAIYFSGASMLFKPSSDLLTISGVKYVSGNDSISEKLMLQDLAYAYLSDARKQLFEGQESAKKLAISTVSKLKALKPIDQDDFFDKYNKIKNQFLHGQALLIVDKGSANYYFMQAKEVDKAKEVQTIFLDAYNTQISIMGQMLVGDPTGKIYTTVLSDLNQFYLSWISYLTDINAIAEIIKLKGQLRNLYKLTAERCVNFKFKGPMFPGMTQHHYLMAASNYEATAKQYQGEGDQADYKLMQTDVGKAYFLACAQNIFIYFYGKKNGINYQPSAGFGQSTETIIPRKHISFDMLFKQYKSFKSGGNVNSGIISAYSDVQKLLLDASIFYQLLSSKYQKEANAIIAHQSEKFATSKNAVSQASEGQVGVDPKLLTVLKSMNILTSKQSLIPYREKGMLTNLFNNSERVFMKLIGEPAALASWCNILNMAIAYQYIDDYEDGLSSAKAGSKNFDKDFSSKWQNFFSSVQKDVSSFVAPPSAYIG